MSQAGAVVEQEEREPGEELPATQTTFYLEAGKLRIDTKSSEGEETVLLYDQSKAVVWVIDPPARTYVEITPAQVEELRQRLDEASKQMEAQLAELPPEQRALIEEMMKQQLGRSGTVTVQEVGTEEKVNGFVCTRYQVLTDGERTAELWAAPHEQLQLRHEEYETFRALGQFFKALGQSAPVRTGWLPGEHQAEGVPVRRLTYAGSRLIAEGQVTKAERRTLEPSLFVLPSGLKKRKFELGEE
jgi:hypothetical protein